LFERIIIGMGVNNTKKTMFAQEERMAWIAEAFKDIHRWKPWPSKD
jgi:phosphopantetheine adenylyltransferase